MSSLIDFKLSSVRDDGKTITAIVTYYTGDISTENELDIKSNTLIPVKRYRRTAIVRREKLEFPRETDYVHMLKKNLKKEGIILSKTPIKEQNV